MDKYNSTSSLCLYVRTELEASTGETDYVMMKFTYYSNVHQNSVKRGFLLTGTEQSNLRLDSLQIKFLC